MLSRATLGRVSMSYRRGYIAGYYGARDPLQGANAGPDADRYRQVYTGRFAAFDYREGILAGQNDRLWAEVYVPFDRSN